MDDSMSAGKVNLLVGEFYRSALSVPLPRFRQTLLREVGQMLPFDAALWGTGDADAGRFHSLALLGLEQGFARALEQTRDINPMYSRLLQQPDHPVAMTDLMADEDFFVSELYQRACRPFRIHRILGASCRDPRNRIYNLIGLFRFNPSRDFSREECHLQQQLTFHMMNAVSLAYSVHLSRVSSEGGGSGAAICDRHGICHEVQPSFLSLIEQKYPDWQGDRLPFTLPSPAGSGEIQVEDLRISSTAVGDLYCVRAREDGPMDMLTKREREIVRSICCGLSYKEVARPLGIAPSTVSNHVYRVFEKLGVSSRSELAKMFSQAQHLH